MAVKRGFFFSTDALLALMLIGGGFLLFSAIYAYKQPTAQINYAPMDIIRILSTTKVIEFDNPILKELIFNGTIPETEYDNTVIEEIGILWAKNNTEIAEVLIQNITAQLVPRTYGMMAIYGNQTMYSRNISRQKDLAVYKSMITGIQKSRPIKGTSARIFLTGGEEQLARSIYAYFGGFEGQGNITKIIQQTPSDANITKVYMEISAGNNFSLYINGTHCGDFVVSGRNMEADAFDITSCKNLINKDITTEFTLVFPEEIESAYVAGGFIRIDYYTKQIYYKDIDSEVFLFSGISGIINFYSAIDIPGDLNSMEVYLHYFANHSNNSNSTLSLLIGNTLIYSDNYSNTTISVYINNSNLSSLIDYKAISNQTVPVRLGFENLSFVRTISDRGNGDVVVVNDVSGSMNWRFDDTNTGVERFCKDPLLKLNSTQRLSLLKCILDDFNRQIVVNTSGNRIGLVSYYSGIRDILSLTKNSTLILDQIKQYYANGGTCISCGVYQGVNILMGNNVTDLLHNKWRYTSEFQVSEPPGWTAVDYDDSLWQEGTLKFGIGFPADYYAGNTIQAYLWPHPSDKIAPVDFNSGIYSKGNTFGLPTAITIMPIKNMNFTGPSLNSWQSTGSVATESSRIAEFMYDNFNRPNNDNIGSNWMEVPNGGNWQIFNNYLVESTNSAPGSRDDGYGPYAYYRNGFNWKDYTVNARIRPNDNDCIGLLFRYNDNQNYYRFRIDNDNFGGLFSRLERIHSGTRTILWSNEGSSSGFSTDNWNNMIIEVTGTNIKIYRGSTLIAQANDNTLANGTVAVYAWAMDDGNYGADFDYINVSTNVFGMTDYFIVDSWVGGIGYVNQTFTSPTSSPNNVSLTLRHSTNDLYFNGTAYLFCNITSPIGETEVWSVNWSANNNTERPKEEIIDITNLITSDTFSYNLLCGAVVSNGTSRTVVAFDDIGVTINYTPSIESTDDGWDWQGGVFGYNGNYTDFYYNATGNLEFVVNGSGSGSNSGAWGIQINITPEMIDMMNSNGGKALLSFNYRWDAADDGSSSVFETSDEVWVKGFFMNRTGSKHYLGTEMSSDDGDAGEEIWSADDPDYEHSGHFVQDITEWITGEGYYYLAIGGKLRRDSSSEIGSFSFDNIQLVFTNTSNNTFYRNKFFVLDATGIDENVYINITSDDGADVYINGNLVDSYTGHVDNRVTQISKALLNEGENIMGIKLYNSDSNGKLQVGLYANATKRQKALVLMSDGEANVCVDDGGMVDNGCDNCAGSGCCPDAIGQLSVPCPDLPEIDQAEFSDGDEDAAEQLINITCYYQKKYNLSIYTVAFGSVGTGGRKTLNLTALCDPEYNSTNNTHYYESDNPSGLSLIYSEIAEKLSNSFSYKVQQIITIVGNFEKSYLYPDSYIMLNYTPYTQPVQYGEVPIFFEYKNPENCTFSVFIPSQVRPIEAAVTSYSGTHWTDLLTINNSMGTFVFYNLSRFSTDYSYMGDPFAIPFSTSYIVRGETNTIKINVGDEPTNTSNCSVNNTFLYTGLINVVNFTLPYSEVKYKAEGCNWTIELEDLTLTNVSVPSSYSGSKKCFYTNSSHDSSGYDSDDSYDVAMHLLLTHLDYNNDGRVFINFHEEDAVIDAKVVRDIPYLWGPTIVEVRVWQ
ncbi:MAG: VWA domain-containing protein [Candidatus Woesearchaeota archaeon]